MAGGYKSPTAVLSHILQSLPFTELFALAWCPRPAFDRKANPASFKLQLQRSSLKIVSRPNVSSG
jgi:hypothetical protein